MDEIKYTIITKMERKDYRKFLYLATFFRNKAMLPMIAVIALAGSVLLNCNASRMSWVAAVLCWPFFFALAIGVICFQIERKNKKRITTDQTGTFDSETVLEFYEDKVAMQSSEPKSTGELKYTQFFSLLESKDYFIFYITATQAALIRKKDVDPLDAFRSFLKAQFGDRYHHI